MKDKITELVFDTIELYTDGSAGPTNPGKGSYAYIIRYLSKNEKTEGFDDKRIEGSCAYHLTTNNRMEMMGVLKGLTHIYELLSEWKHNDTEEIEHIRFIKVYSDSSYVCNTLNRGWINKWKRDNWISSTKEAVKNKDVWILLEKIINDIFYVFRIKVNLIHIRGHFQYILNERCDELAKATRKHSDNFLTDIEYEKERR